MTWWQERAKGRARQTNAGLLLALSLLAGSAAARPVAIGGAVQSAGVASRVVGGVELLAVWTLPRVGISVRNDPNDLRLRLGGRELRWSPAQGWRALGFTLQGTLSAPQVLNGSLHAPLDALRALNVPVKVDSPEVLDFAAPTSVPTATLPPSVPAPASTPRPEGAAASPPPAGVALSPVAPPPTQTFTPTANLDTVRVSRTLYRSVEVQRVVLELSGAAAHAVTRQSAGLTVTLPGVTSSASTQTLPSGDTLTIVPTAVGSAVSLTTGGGRSEIFTLNDPARVVIDTTTYTEEGVPPPINPDSLPPGVTYRRAGTLHLLSFDPAQYATKVVSAPLGRAVDVAQLVRGAGGVAGMNGGYFDPASSLPVDLVAVGGLMTAGSLERRATLGFTASGEALFGYPRPRYFLSGAFGSVMVNAVRATAAPTLLTAFVGDGRTRVGDSGLTTLYVPLNGRAVQSALSGPNVPPPGTLSFTFDPARYPQLPRFAGAPLSATLNWQAHDQPWPDAVDALSAGPLLVQGGRVALNPAREGFDTGTNIWRATRQVAYGTLGGQPTLAYLEHGTPETFAAALAGAGLRDAVRMDSGSSATVYLQGGYAGLGGYLNTVWSRPVPNALVLVPRVNAKR